MQFPREKDGSFGDWILGAFVSLEHNGHTYLGNIVEVSEREDHTDPQRATVRHFNGEPWDIEPLVASLNWIKNDYSEVK